MAAPRVIVTRPAPEAARWVAAMRARDLRAEALPLIDIVAEPPHDALIDARRQLGRYAAAMFVSGNAVSGFFESNRAVGQIGQAGAAIQTRAWSPGPGTTAALQHAGWPADRIDAPAADAAQFDSEALWTRVAPQVHPGVRVLIVRGGDAHGRPAGRDWLATRLVAIGAVVEQVVAYRRAAPTLDAGQRALARAAARDGSLWLFSSAQAIAHLVAVVPDCDWTTARALATHPRIAQAARATGFGSVREVRPSLAEVLASIESFA